MLLSRVFMTIYCSDDQFLVTGSRDGTIALWRVTDEMIEQVCLYLAFIILVDFDKMPRWNNEYHFLPSARCSSTGRVTLKPVIFLHSEADSVELPFGRISCRLQACYRF